MGKYTYKVNFEKAKNAGVSKEEYSRESSKLTILNWIANELAEANRLKRYELKRLLPHTADCSCHGTGRIIVDCTCKLDLEDQA